MQTKELKTSLTSVWIKFLFRFKIRILAQKLTAMACISHGFLIGSFAYVATVANICHDDLLLTPYNSLLTVILCFNAAESVQVKKFYYIPQTLTECC
jgi:formate-dependent nitrite reductase membrane component NrfD